MKRAIASLTEHLARIEQQGLYRTVRPIDGIDFVTNDYLGLSRHPDIHARLRTRMDEAGSEAALGAPASRLLCGHTRGHAVLESRLATFKGTESALLFANGYAANVGLLSALLQPEDRVISDAQNHASIIDGIRLSRCAQREVVPHIDLGAIEAVLRRPHPVGQTYIVTESLFSMDGDAAPLSRYVELAEHYDAALIVDDAHGTGVFGAIRGSGLTEGLAHRVLAVVSTFGKALGSFGAFVGGPVRLREFLINRARSFIFTTAPPPLLLHAVEASLDVLSTRIELGPTVVARADLLRQRLQTIGVDTLSSTGPIVPVIVGDNTRALDVAASVKAAGYDVRAVRPPTVAAGTARLRICVHADHTVTQIHGLADAVEAALKGRHSK